MKICIEGGLTWSRWEMGPWFRVASGKNWNWYGRLLASPHQLGSISTLMVEMSLSVAEVLFGFQFIQIGQFRPLSRVRWRSLPREDGEQNTCVAAGGDYILALSIAFVLEHVFHAHFGLYNIYIYEYFHPAHMYLSNLYVHTHIYIYIYISCIHPGALRGSRGRQCLLRALSNTKRTSLGPHKPGSAYPHQGIGAVNDTCFSISHSNGNTIQALIVGYWDAEKPQRN